MTAMDEGGQGNDGVDQDALMKEWAAMAGGDGGAPAGGADQSAADWEAMLAGGDSDAGAPKDAARVLNQDEIDSLLGFDNDAGGGGERQL